MKCIGLMGLSITKSISSSQFSHHSFWKKALNKPHWNYPNLERDSQKRLIFVTHVYFYHDNIHSSYLKSLKKKFPKPVPSSCLCTCTYQYFDNLKIKTDYKLSPRSLTHSYFLHPPVPHLTPWFVNRQLGGKSIIRYVIHLRIIWFFPHSTIKTQTG